MVIQDRLLLPVQKPVGTRDLRVVPVRLPIPLAPIIVLAGGDANPSQQAGNRYLRTARPVLREPNYLVADTRFYPVLA